MLEADYRVLLTVEFAIPAGTPPEKARQMLSSGAVNLALSLAPLVREVNAYIVPLAEMAKYKPPPQQ